VKKTAVGARDSRNKLAHDLLTLSHKDFNSLVDCSRQLFSGLCIAFSCVSEKLSFRDGFDSANDALAEIESVLKPTVTLFNLSDEERRALNEQAR
jgi:hypothetical protein